MSITRLPEPCRYPVLGSIQPEPYYHYPSAAEALAVAIELAGADFIPGTGTCAVPCWTVTCDGCGWQLQDPEPSAGHEPLHARSLVQAQDYAQDEGWLTDWITAVCPLCCTDDAADQADAAEVPSCLSALAPAVMCPDHPGRELIPLPGGGARGTCPEDGASHQMETPEVPA